MNQHILRHAGNQATIATRGAELQFLRWAGTEVLWEAGPLWPRHAPLLFPVVGALKGDRLWHQGKGHALPRHGFARDLDFTWIERSEAACCLRLVDDDQTRAAYPWPFRLQVSYALDAGGLRQEISLHNPADAPLPASLGLHPAFRWPLAGGLSKAAHGLTFEQDEPGALRRLSAAGLLTAKPQPTPIQNRTLMLDETLFQADALIFLEPRSRGLSFACPGGPSLRLSWSGFPQLGLWAKPDEGPSFLCIEPWEGHASPEDWDGEFTEKPGAFQVDPGATRHWSLRIDPRG